MIYEEFAASGIAAQYVENYWRFSIAEGAAVAATHSIVPDGLVSLSAALLGPQVLSVVVVGPATRAHVVPLQPGVRHAGMRFRPGAASALLGIDARAIAGTIMPIEQVCPGHRDWAVDALGRAFADAPHVGLDDSVGALAITAAAVDRVAAVAGNRLIASEGRASIATLVAEAGFGERQFRTRFNAATGLSPKAFARVRRQHAVWTSLVQGEAKSFADASYAAGYADQPHFTRETRSVFEASPGKVHAYLNGIDHRFRDAPPEHEIV